MSQEESNYGSIVKEYYEHKLSNKDKSWSETCRRSAEKFIDWCNENDIEPENYEFNKYDIENYKTYLEDQDNDYAGSTVKNMLLAIRDFLSYVSVQYDWEAIFAKGTPGSIYSADIHPDKETRYKAETGEKIPYITKKQHQTLLDTCNNVRDDLILRLLYDTGCRPSELTSLTLDDVDMDMLKDGSFTVQTAKRDNHPRTVYISSITKRKMIKWIYKGKRKAYSSYADESEYILLTRRSPHMNPALVNRQIKRLADRAGIQEVAYTNKSNTQLRGETKKIERDFVKINAKSYRHQFAVRGCKNSIPLPLLKDLMGHTSTESLEHYTKFYPEDYRKAWEQYLNN